MSTFKDLIAKVADGHDLSPDEAREAFEVILSGLRNAVAAGRVPDGPAGCAARALPK